MPLQEEVSLLLTARFTGAGAFGELQTAVDNAKRQAEGLSTALHGVGSGVDWAPAHAGIEGITLRLGLATEATRLLSAELQHVIDQAGLAGLGGIPAASGARAAGRTAAASVAAQMGGVEMGTLGQMDPRLPGIVSHLQQREAALAAMMDAGLSRSMAGQALSRLEQPAFSAGQRALIGAGSEALGTGGRLGYGLSLMGPEALAIGGAALLGGVASKMGADFQSAVNRTVAEYAPPGTSPAQQLQMAQQLDTGIRNFVASGRSLVGGTTLANDIEMLMAHGYGMQTGLALLQPLTTLAGQNRQKDITQGVNLLNVLAANFTPAQRQDPAAMIKQVDFISAVEKLTTVKPGEVTGALPTLMTAIQGTPITKEDITGLFLKIAMGNPHPAIVASGLSRLVGDITTKNTVGAYKEAASIGLPMGPGAVDAAGGIYPYLQEVQQKTLTAAGGDPEQQRRILAQIFPQTGTRGGGALTAFIQLMQGGGLLQAGGLSTDLYRSGGTTADVQRQLQLGIDQQTSMLMNRAGADMITAGEALNQQVVPLLLKAGGGLLDFAEKGAADLGQFGNFLDGLARQANLPQSGIGHVLGAIGHAGDVAASYLGLGAPGHNLGDDLRGLSGGQGAGRWVSGPHGARVWLPTQTSLASSAPPSFTGAPGGIGAEPFVGAGFQLGRDALNGPTIAAATVATGHLTVFAQAVQLANTALLGMAAHLRAQTDPVASAIYGHATAGQRAAGVQLQARTDAILAAQRHLSAAASNQAVREDRTLLSVMERTRINPLTGQATSITDINNALATLHSDLATSAYDTLQRKSIFTSEQFTAGKFADALLRANLPAMQLIRPNVSSLNLREASYGSSIAHMTGASLGAAQTIALLQSMLQKDEATITELRQEVAYLRNIDRTMGVIAHNTTPSHKVHTRGVPHGIHVPIS